MVFNIYKNKKVFITGHTGFKGSWLSLWLTKLGAEVCGYSLEPETNPSMFEALNIKDKISKSVIGNILDETHLKEVMTSFSPDIVFHLAAQPLVIKSYEEPKLTYETNIIGTLNVLECARKCPSVKAFVNITTDKCYENKETMEGYKETDVLGGYDMYSSSKACSEILSSSYRRSFLQNKGFALATARAGNVIGGGDWAKDRLIPDCARSISINKAVEIRNPNSIRPWQHVLEPLSGYLLLGERLLTDGDKFAESFNFGPQAGSLLKVEDIVKMFVNSYGQGKITVNRDFNAPHEAGILSLNIDKAQNILKWVPTYNCEQAISITADWYRNFYSKNTDMYEYTIKQINDYEAQIKWKQN